MHHIILYNNKQLTISKSNNINKTSNLIVDPYTIVSCSIYINTIQKLSALLYTLSRFHFFKLFNEKLANRLYSRKTVKT